MASLRRALELDERLVRAWHALGSALRDNSDLAAAESALRRALALEPGSTLLWASLAGVLRLAGRPEDAVEAYRESRRLGEVGPEVLDAEVGALIDCLRIEDAREASSLLLERFPGFAPAYTTRANLDWEYGAGEAGLVAPESNDAAFFRKAVEAQPENTELQVGYVRFLIETKRGEEAFERLQELRRREDHPRLIALQANALEISGQSERAASLYAEADRSLGAQDPSFNNAYVRHLLKSGQWSAAAARAERTLALDPQRQETWAYLATAWRLLGDPREDWLCGFERLVALRPIDVPRGWRDMPDFLDDLRDALEPLHRAKTQPVAQSLRGGSQTPGRLFGRGEPRIEVLRQALLSTIEAWLAGLRSEERHPFLGRLGRSVQFTGSWSVKLWRSGSHANHFHNEGWMSSAFYVALPPSVSEAGESAHGGITAGALQLGQPPLELGLDLQPRRIIQPRAGHVALFPSYLWHGTVPFDDAEPRITVAFDMLPVGRVQAY
ncbi:Tetratricopeptide repeat-containing protein [Aquimonas voraii]|uniref:Tetratricopeptide repeat-containing protein n=2 Tax=Aquimonas voraii TaxID=265719 RepID=A0A1G6ZCY1_9GAMM|nr:Tetratricopeptide repeat-containing protein [Aquimonas voraii]